MPAIRFLRTGKQRIHPKCLSDEQIKLATANALVVRKDGCTSQSEARLVVREFEQIRGIEFMEPFAPVSMHASIRILFAIAAAEDLKIHQMDVVSAFLAGYLNEEVYIDQPEGVEQGKDLVCLLIKSLYGLKQDLRIWNRKMGKALLKLGFRHL
jgi:Reverse transcriptase (RNA-dependent DNA polymerase)